LLSALSAIAVSGTEPVEVARGAGQQQPQQPQLAIGSDCVIHLVYGVGHVVRYHQSKDGGATFTGPVELPPVHAMSLGMRRGPRIAVAGRAICVTAIGGAQGEGRDGDLQALHSADGGQSWAGPVRVNDVADAAREGLHGMAAGPRGELCCVWLDLRNNQTEVMACISQDGGATWGKNVLVYKSPDGSVCECCHPSVTFDRQGRIYVLWRNSLGGNRDMYVASSADGGKTFGNATKLGVGTWPLDACPMDGGAIAAGAEGRGAAVWRRGNDVYLSSLGQMRERRLGVGEQPWIALTNRGPVVVWLKARSESAYLLMPDSASPVEIATQAADPVIAVEPRERGTVIVAWEAHKRESVSIVCQAIRATND
jgi:hypothetical protein